MLTYILILILASTATAQTVINGGRVLTGSWDASGALSSKPTKTGAALPATCGVGELFFLTTATAGNNLYLCSSVNAWTPSLAPQLPEPVNQVFAGPASGNSALPGFRSLLKSDLPSTAVHTDQSNAYTGGTQDMSLAGATLPARTGSTLPSTCGQGEFFFLLTAPPGKNLYICYAVNSWSQISGSSGGASGGPVASAPICNAGGYGQIYYPTDSPYSLWCGGTAWNYVLNGIAVAPPDNSQFTWVQQSGGSVTVSGGVSATIGDVYLLTPAGTSANFLPQMRVLTNPYGNLWTLTAAIAMAPGNSAFGSATGSAGLVVRNPTNSGNFTNGYTDFRVSFSGAYGTASIQLEGRDSNNGIYAGGPSIGVDTLPVQGVMWLRLHADGTNLIGQFSADSGRNWYTVAKYPITTTTGTTGSLGQVGWFVSPDNQQNAVGASLLHWSLVNY